MSLDNIIKIFFEILSKNCCQCNLILLQISFGRGEGFEERKRETTL